MNRLVIGFLPIAGIMGAMSITPAVASTWVNIGKNSYGSTYDVDLDSIRRDGDNVTFTLSVRYGSKSQDSDTDGYVSIRKANCADHTFADLHTDYTKNGSVFRSSGEEETRTAKSGSIAGLVLDKVCAP